MDSGEQSLLTQILAVIGAAGVVVGIGFKLYEHRSAKARKRVLDERHAENKALGERALEVASDAVAEARRAANAASDSAKSAEKSTEVQLKEFAKKEAAEKAANNAVLQTRAQVVAHLGSGQTRLMAALIWHYPSFLRSDMFGASPFPNLEAVRPDSLLYLVDVGYLTATPMPGGAGIKSFTRTSEGMAFAEEWCNCKS
jgi:hypothetical protein